MTKRVLHITEDITIYAREILDTTLFFEGIFTVTIIPLTPAEKLALDLLNRSSCKLVNFYNNDDNFDNETASLIGIDNTQFIEIY